MKIKSGPTKWTKDIKCETCDVVLECEEKDVCIGYFGPSWGGETPEEKTFVECPLCGEHVTFDAPPRIRRIAKEK